MGPLGDAMVVANVQLSTTFWSGDAFNVCHCRLPRDVTFDVISTSNLVDHVGLLNLLVTCQPRLKQYDDYATRTLCLSVCLSACFRVSQLSAVSSPRTGVTAM